MKHIRKFNEGIDRDDYWESQESDIRNYFYSIMDGAYGTVDIKKQKVSSDLTRSFESNFSRPGYYPGFRVDIRSTVDQLNFDKISKYYLELAEVQDRLMGGFEKVKIFRSNSANNLDNITIMIIDTNWDKVVWDDKTVATDFLKDKFSISVRYGQLSIEKLEGGIKLKYKQPLSRIKSLENLNKVRDELAKQAPNYRFNIETETNNSGLVIAYIVTYVDKKESLKGD